MANGGLPYYLKRLNIAEKLIAINLAVFILTGLASALLGFSTDSILYWFELPKDFFAFLSKPWSLVTYSFFHAGIGHIFWNMLILYFTGRIFLNLFDNQRFINVYFLGVILGGLLFLASYNVFPTLLHTNTSLIGASAGVTAVLIFICTYIPNQEVRLFGLINIKLWYLGAFVVLVDLIQIAGGENIGGRLAHLGGAFLGYIYARQLLNGRDMGQGFSKMLDTIGNLFKPGKRKAPLKTVHRRDKAKGAKNGIDYNKETRQKKIDAILDKISKSGYESLSKAEKDFLFKAGKEE
ncbi:MAG: rhomboid family intramembrane serine protease [Bacteroidota bacterium]